MAEQHPTDAELTGIASLCGKLAGIVLTKGTDAGREVMSEILEAVARTHGKHLVFSVKDGEPWYELEDMVR